MNDDDTDLAPRVLLINYLAMRVRMARVGVEHDDDQTAPTDDITMFLFPGASDLGKDGVEISDLPYFTEFQEFMKTWRVDDE